MGVIELVEALTSAVGKSYASDQTRAGLVLSRMDDGSWYALVARYPNTIKQVAAKQVVAKVHRAHFDTAVKDLAVLWLARADAIGSEADDLRDIVNSAPSRFRLLGVD